MINLGLGRIKKLLDHISNPQKYLKVFHIAGTNGKGSVATYLESILKKSGRSTGKFTSPHLISPNDAIQINQTSIDRDYYKKLTDEMMKISVENQIGATEFEIQTAVSFRAFAHHQVDVGIIEVGLGGLEDATNILDSPNVLCSAITKVGIDHESFLGTSLSSIAKQKAGIIKNKVPCVTDGTNDPIVLDIIKSTCYNASAPLHSVLAPYSASTEPVPQFDKQNRAVAKTCIQQVFPDISDNVIVEGIESAFWPGRLQWLDSNILVDGAHNVLAALELRKYVDRLSRPIHWVVAFSKDSSPILQILLRPGDRVTATEFGAVEGMPWVHSQPASLVSEVATNLGANTTVIPRFSPKLIKSDELTVICGSLYLVANVLSSKFAEEFKRN